MKINCLECGFNFDLDEAYEDYEGEIKCYVCGHLLLIKTVEGYVKCVKSAIPVPPKVNRRPEARV
jgi:DNA-directed RNA polymerase subunit RPC12/RpoP